VLRVRYRPIPSWLYHGLFVASRTNPSRRKRREEERGPAPRSPLACSSTRRLLARVRPPTSATQAQARALGVPPLEMSKTTPYGSGSPTKRRSMSSRNISWMMVQHQMVLEDTSKYESHLSFAPVSTSLWCITSSRDQGESSNKDHRSFSNASSNMLFLGLFGCSRHGSLTQSTRSSRGLRESYPCICVVSSILLVAQDDSLTGFAMRRPDIAVLVDNRDPPLPELQSV
jgi:hypothetical protein